LSLAAAEVFFADLFHGGKRPVVVVTRDALHRGEAVLVVPLTTSRVTERRRYRNYVFVPRGAGGVREDSVAVTHLVQPAEVALLRERWGALPPALLEAVVLGIAGSIGVGD